MAWKTEQSVVALGAAAVAMAGRLALAIGLCFHHHSPQQAAVAFPFHQPAANQLRGHHLGRAAEEGVGQGWEILDDGLGSDRNDLKICLALV